MNDEHTALGIAIDTLKNIQDNANEAYSEGTVIDARWLKIYIEQTLLKIENVKKR